MSCPSIGPNCFGPVQNVLDIGQKTEFRIKSHFGPVLNQFGTDLFKTQINLLVSTQLINWAANDHNDPSFEGGKLKDKASLEK